MSCLAFHRRQGTFYFTHKNPWGLQLRLQSICSSLILYYKRGSASDVLITEIISKGFSVSIQEYINKIADS